MSFILQGTMKKSAGTHYIFASQRAQRAHNELMMTHKREMRMIDDMEVPEGWRRVRLGDLGTFKTSSVDKKVNKGEKWVKLINYMDVYKHNFVDKSLELMDVTANDHEIAVSRVKKGDILFTPSSETPDDIGHSGVVLGCPPNTLYSYHLMRLDIKGEIELDLKFRGYFCNYGGVLKEFARISTGVTRFTLCKSDFENTKVIIPSSFPEQRKIAEILETIDNAIERTNTIIEKYKRIKQGLMQDLLTRGVVENEELGVMNYELRDEKKHGFKDSPLGRIPEEWEVVELGEVIEIFDRQRIPLDSEYRLTIKGGIPYCGATGVINYINDYIFDGEYVLIAEDGGRFNRFEETAYIMKGKFWANNHVHIVIGKRSVLSNLFLMYSINFQDISYYISGSTREKLNQQLLKSVYILFPSSLLEQHRIASILSQTDETIEKEQKYKQKLESIKQGLMDDLLTGKVKVNYELGVRSYELGVVVR